MVPIEVNYKKCLLSNGKDCKNCIMICPMRVLGVRDGRIKALRPEECIACHCCKGSCPAGLEVIQVDETTHLEAKDIHKPKPSWKGLNVHIGQLTLPTPLILASGPVGRNSRGWFRAAAAGCGAMVTKTTTPVPWAGNPAVRILPYEEESVLSCEGLPNLGAVGTANEVKRAKALDPRFLLVPNISAATEKEFVEMAKLLEDAGADALELAIKGCPNYMGDTKMAEGYWNEDPDKAFHLVNAVRRAVKIPLWIKGSNEVDFVLAYEEAGADAVLIRYRSIHAMPLNAITGKPLLSDPRGMANFHGPYAKFPGIKLVADISRGLKIPIIGNGGITCGQDVIDYIRAGASAVQLLTIIIRKGMPVVARILSEVETYLKNHGYKSLEEIRGDVLQYLRI